MRVIPGGASGAPKSKRRPDRPDEESWFRFLRMKVGKAGNPDTLEPDLHNAAIVLQFDPAWRGVLQLNEFSGECFFVKPPPWDDVRPFVPRTWTDQDATRVACWFAMHQRWVCRMKSSTCLEAMLVVAHDSAFHPVRSYLESLEWDGVERLDSWVSTYLGAEHRPQTTAKMGRMWLVSAVARVMEPGCKADHVLILEGRQRAGKSTTAAVLFGEWFNDSPIDLGSKDSMQGLRGMWGNELAELVDMVKSSARARAKQFFSSSCDYFRPSYGKGFVKVPRQCVFLGTVNPGANGYLTDDENRRYWPVTCHRIDLEALRRDRDQLWAEAVHQYREGRPWWPDHAESDAFAEEQASRYQEDSWDAIVGAWMSGPEAQRVIARNDGAGVSVADVCVHALGMEHKDVGASEQARVGKSLQRLGCTMSRVRMTDVIGAKRPRYYVLHTESPGNDDVPL